MVQPRVTVEYDAQADTYFWLRQPVDGSEVDELRRRVAAVYEPLTPMAFLMLDPPVAGESSGPSGVLAAIPDLPPEVHGISVPHALGELAQALAAAPMPPAERKAQVIAALEALDVDAVARGVAWSAEVLGLVTERDEPVEVDVKVVADGVPLGGLTGARLDDRPVCFVNVARQGGSALAEAAIHEALHALDMSCRSDQSLLDRLRNEPGTGPQLWHVPLFVVAAEATRRFVDASHVDFGDTHGYYAKVPREIAELDARGLIADLRRGRGVGAE